MSPFPASPSEKFKNITRCAYSTSICRQTRRNHIKKKTWQRNTMQHNESSLNLKRFHFRQLKSGSQEKQRKTSRSPENLT